jgi:hypothetical protein
LEQNQVTVDVKHERSDIMRVHFREWKEASSFVLRLSRTWFGKGNRTAIPKGRIRLKLPGPLSVEVLRLNVVEEAH